jgi:hypothetical protein
MSILNPRVSAPTTSADLCRANGWVVGDKIERRRSVVAGGYRLRVRLTAIGEDGVLGRLVDAGFPSQEHQWDLIGEEWRRV